MRICGATRSGVVGGETTVTPETSDVFAALLQVIQDRKAQRPERSYVVSLLEGGPKKIGEKIAEEAGEVVEAGLCSGAEARAAIVHEIADLFFHTFVLMGYHDITLAEVEQELARRFGTGGIEEKEKRGISQRRSKGDQGMTEMGR